MALGTEIALIKALGGGGASLPSVTSADAGKVLGVNDSGVWVASKRGIYEIIIKFTSAELDTLWCKSLESETDDVPVEELYDAILANKIVRAKLYVYINGEWSYSQFALVLNPFVLNLPEDDTLYLEMRTGLIDLTAIGGSGFGYIGGHGVETIVGESITVIS